MEHQNIYPAHRAKQMEFILTQAEELMIEKGIEKVTVTDVIRKTHLMRSTFYRYFSSKEELLWQIMQKHICQFMAGFENKMRQQCPKNTYSIISLFFEELYLQYQTNPSTFLFIRLYRTTYLENTHYSGYTNRSQLQSHYRSGGLIQLLLQNYPDSSVSFSDSVYETGVMLVYAPISFAAELLQISDDLDAKYMVSSQNVFRTYLDSLLKSIRC